ncbi:HAMP domain-containing protein [Kribbella capetownensis]|uniref:histidine kinase n=1 Tax=Kribbella capetownensis TaxID=1572659 RepID=A0A4R0JFQ6_9ACTN|nr:CHASE3 domain-containing protein [Kribbella capetownensis]TCC44987.1 HAMP domain-containing protein [Kribbella capetownensis]
MRGLGLSVRIITASVLLAVIIAAAFAVLLSSVTELRSLERRAQQSEDVLVAANRLERLIVEMEDGQRGFLLTGSEQFLQPWVEGRAEFAQQAAALENLVADNAEQHARAEALTRAGTSYLNDYSVPLVAAARRDRTSIDLLPATTEGRQRVDAMRTQFDQLLDAEKQLAMTRQDSARDAAGRAMFAAAAGLTGSVLLVALFTWYLNRSILHPVRRTAAMAERLAAGDLSARVSDHGVGEMGVLQRTFNAMAAAVQQAQRDLAGSRARIVAAADRARQRIERDLHDGTQQRLVALALQLRAGEAAVPPDQPEVRAQLANAARELTNATDELRELSRGIHPAILTEGGLGPALKALARRSPVPSELTVDIPARLPEPIEVCAYYVASEALANTVKHANASEVWIDARVSEGRLHLSVRDDGTGGAVPDQGTGLIGLADRVEALGGTISVDSPVGVGTTLLVDLPLESGLDSGTDSQPSWSRPGNRIHP